MMGAMRTPTALLALALLPVAAVVAAGCGDEAPGASQPPREVEMRNLRFDPEEFAVVRGQKVRWTNGESIQHTVVAREGAKFDSGLLDQGESFEFTPDDAGVVQFVCKLHPGMVGTITVTG